MLPRLALLLLGVAALWAAPNESMKLVFEDNFDAKEIDKTKWGVNNTEGVKIVTGQLSLEITPGTQPKFWRGSGVNTNGKFSVLNGYVEASIMWVQTGGHGCGFSVGNADNRNPAASMSFGGGGSNVGLSLGIVNEERGRTLSPNENPIPPNDSYSKKFHRFAFYWTPTDYRWYVDGRLVQTMRQPPTPKPMFISLGHSPGGEAGYMPKYPDPTRGPEPMRVDWVKVWK